MWLLCVSHEKQAALSLSLTSGLDFRLREERGERKRENRAKVDDAKIRASRRRGQNTTAARTELRTTAAAAAAIATATETAETAEPTMTSTAATTATAATLATTMPL